MLLSHVATGLAPIDLYYIVNNSPIVAITKLIHLMLFIFFKKGNSCTFTEFQMDKSLETIYIPD